MGTGHSIEFSSYRCSRREKMWGISVVGNQSHSEVFEADYFHSSPNQDYRKGDDDTKLDEDIICIYYSNHALLTKGLLNGTYLNPVKSSIGGVLLTVPNIVANK